MIGKISSLIVGAVFLGGLPLVHSSEVLEEIDAKVVVREHAKTGRPYVAITREESPHDVIHPSEFPLAAVKRPDYRLLDPKFKPGQISYDGPSSNRTKVYVLAASLAAAGTLSSLAASAAIPAATGTGSAGGAGVFAGGGAAVGAGSISTAWFKTRPRPDEDDFIRESGARAVKPGYSSVKELS